MAYVYVGAERPGRHHRRAHPGTHPSHNKPPQNTQNTYYPTKCSLRRNIGVIKQAVIKPTFFKDIIKNKRIYITILRSILPVIFFSENWIKSTKSPSSSTTAQGRHNSRWIKVVQDRPQKESVKRCGKNISHQFTITGSNGLARQAQDQLQIGREWNLKWPK